MYYPEGNQLYYWYTDIYVSFDGNDVTGRGTADSPYRTIQKAMNDALFNEPSGSQIPYDGRQYGWGIRDQRGSDRLYNRDQIVIMPGIYRGLGNRNLRPGGKLLDVKAQYWNPVNPFQTAVDCENSGDTFLVETSQRYWDNNDNTDKESITVRGINIVRCETYKTYSLYDPFTNSNVPYNNPIKVLANQPYIEPRVMTNRPGRSNPGVPTY